MCGRVTLKDEDPIRELYESFEVADCLPCQRLPRYNVGPSERLPVIIQQAGGNRCVDAIWWLLLQDTEHGMKPNQKWKTFNARAERLTESRLYSKPFKSRRCLIPVSGYYEWKKDPDSDSRIPWFIAPNDGTVLCLAGLYTRWGEGDESVWSCTVITTEGHPRLLDIHRKSTPVTVPEKDRARWLDPQQQDTSVFGFIHEPQFGRKMRVAQVDPAMNSSRNKSPASIHETGEAFTFDDR